MENKYFILLKIIETQRQITIIVFWVNYRNSSYMLIER